jgi:putative nucleotidyltransferase with HDIG domain
MKTGNLKKIIGRISDLPTLPRTVLKITELVNDPKSSARDLSRVITDDQVLTARLLKLVNSSFYGFPQRIATVTGAIVLLGFDAIRNLLLTTTVFGLFSRKVKEDRFGVEAFWDHSLGCAIGAKVIGDYLRYDKVEELFVSGLLHDIGKLVEFLYLPEDFSRVMSLVEVEDLLLLDAEKRLLDYNHAQVGELLAERWNMSSKLVQVIAHHHQPEMAGRFSREAAVVHLADILCRAMEMGSGGDRKIPHLNHDAWESLQIKANAIEPIAEEMERQFQDISLFITQMA